MRNLLCIFLSLVFLGCQNPTKKNNPQDLVPPKVTYTPSTDSSYKNRIYDSELYGDTNLWLKFNRLAPLHKVQIDTYTNNPLKGLKIAHSINYERSITTCEKGHQYVRAIQIKLENGTLIEFIENHIDLKVSLLITVVNQKLFSIRKLFAEDDYNIYFHYESEYYKLSNGNILFVEQPASWCGIANMYDCYQYFDLKKHEIIQFIEKDEFINTLK